MKERTAAFGEHGAIRMYLLGLVLVTALLVGGVLILKNSQSNKSSSEPTVSVSTESNNSDDKNKETSTNNTNQTSSGSTDKSQSSNSSEQSDTSKEVAATGDTSGNPTTITATGPTEDLLSLVIGTLAVFSVFYAAWNYKLSRSALKNSLAEKRQ